MKRKLIKRILLWGVGLPVSLIVALAAVFFACYAIAPDSTEKAVVKVISIFTPLGTLIENTESVHPAYVALEAKDYDRVMQICDSLHEHSNVTDIELNLVRSTICLNTKRFRAAEIYLKKAIASYTGQEYEAGHYASASINLGRRLCDKGEYAEAVKIITTAIDKLEHNKGRVLMQSSSMPRLHTRLAVSLAKLGKTDEADARFRQAIKSYDDKDVDLNIMYDSEEKKDEYNRMQLEVAESAIAVFMEEGRYDMAKKWFEKEDNAMAYILTNDSLANEDGGLHQYRYHLMKAQMLEHDGDRAGADSEYRRCTEFPASQNSGAIVSRYRYLTASERWSEALEMYTKLDTAIFGNIYSLDNISLFLMPHYRALRGTGQTAKAQQLADTLSLRLGEAIQANKNDDAAELATIYETQQKEAQIAERDAELNRQRVWGLVIALILLSTGFIVYTLIRRRVMKMQAQHEQLENELRIARDIQMSMVPSTFPDLDGLDMYAQMTPAKEVGGDLYGYVLSGSKLYFAVGDVSGKGVPASLFMAQATRLFRTLATQGMMPAEICTRINDALSGDDNQSGMFVTLFLGLLDLTTGHLDFCNAGHNPPAITTANCQSSSQRHTLKERIVNYQFLEVLPNAPIGLWPELQYEGESLPTIMGKKLLIYTDGLNEAENRQQQQFGDDHLLDILRTTPFENARQLIDTLSAAVDSHRDGAEPNDDLTMMCISLPGQA